MLTDHEHQADLEAEQARVVMLDAPNSQHSPDTIKMLSGLVEMLFDTVGKLESRVRALEDQARGRSPSIYTRERA